MRFEEALPLLRQGKKMRREGWTHRFDPEFIYIEEDKKTLRDWFIETDAPTIIGQGHSYGEGRIVDGWSDEWKNASENIQEDILANDWEEVES